MRLIFTVIIVSVFAASLYAGNGHTRTEKNMNVDVKNKVIAGLEKMTGIFTQAEEQVGEMKTQADLTNHIEKTAEKCKEIVQTLKKLFDEHPGFYNEPGIQEQIEPIGQNMEKAIENFQNSVEEWADSHGLTEKEKETLKTKFDKAFQF